MSKGAACGGDCFVAALLAMTVAASGAALSAAAGPQIPAAAPQAKAGPYTVVIDRISQSRTLAINYAADRRKEEPALDSRRMVQVQIAVFPDNPNAASGLATFQITGVSAGNGGRAAYLQHYGGILENPNESAAVRAYVYVPGFPSLAGEIRAVEGQIVAFEKADPIDIEIPLDDGRAPKTVSKDQVKATLREFQNDSGSVQVVIEVECPPGGMLLSGSSDGSYGVSLLDKARRSATSSGGTMITPRDNTAEYRLSFQNLRDAPGWLHIRAIHRGGARRVYPFRIDRIPIPSRQTPRG